MSDTFAPDNDPKLMAQAAADTAPKRRGPAPGFKRKKVLLRPPQREAEQRQPQRTSRRLSDDEILGMFQHEETGEYRLPESLMQQGYAYAWKRMAVVGRPDPSYEADLQRNQWVACQAAEFPGYWMPSGYNGDIVVKDLKLMKRPAEYDALRQRYFQLKARQQRRDQVDQLRAAPPGTGPRDHPQVRPRVNTHYERVSEIE